MPKQLSNLTGYFVSDSNRYQWRRSLRAKQLQVRITPWQGIEVIIPRNCSKRRVRAFLASQRGWIRDTWLRMQSQVVDGELGLPTTMELKAIGEHWQVAFRAPAGSRARVVTAAPGRLTVCGDPADESGCREVLRCWLARHAREHLGPEAERRAQAMGCGFRRLQIRGQRSRWGSCSSSGTLSLNYKLLFLEPELVRYLLVHELSHTRVLDHSRRFWNLVARYEPDWRRLDQELGEAWCDVPGWVEKQ